MIHYADHYIIKPYHALTVALIGVGGNGSHMLRGLAYINNCLKKISDTHPGLFVTAYDMDEVSEANIARQLFFPSDKGRNKAECLIERTNRSFGYNWMAEPREFLFNDQANIWISCVDDGKVRNDIHEWFTHPASNKDQEHSLYWLDIGNGKDFGQIIMGSHGIKQPNKSINELKTIIDLHPEMITKEKDEPSCSTLQSINRQDMFINQFMATFALDLLWKLLKEWQTDYHGVYFNSKELLTTKIPVTN